VIAHIPLKLALSLEPDVLLEYERLLRLAVGPLSGGNYGFARVLEEDWQEYLYQRGSLFRWLLWSAAMIQRSDFLTFGGTPCVCVKIPSDDSIVRVIMRDWFRAKDLIAPSKQCLFFCAAPCGIPTQRRATVVP
jgi:hypothetical protein